MKILSHFIHIICLYSCPIFSQTTANLTASVTLPVVSLLDIEPSGAITMNFSAPSEAGSPLIIPTNNTTKWINYTSAIKSGGLTRRITASINHTIPGIDIKLKANAAIGLGGGVLGNPTSQIILNTIATNIITGIGGAFTGNGVNNGHQLILSLTVNNYSSLTKITNTPIIITYTITE